MTQLLLELSSLEVEPLEVIVDAPELEQDQNLYTIATAQGEGDVSVLRQSALPVNAKCCCCCCPFRPCA